MSLTRIMPTPPGLTGELLLEFFLVFSRLEYAMKAAGWIKTDGGTAEPDWPRLIDELQHEDEAVTAALPAAGQYLLEAPPKKQIRNAAGVLDWSEVRCDDQHRRLSCLLWSVKRVRNNLFHGGKFELLPDLSDRNRRLVEGSLKVIEVLLDVPICEPIRQRYYAYAADGS